MAQSISHGHGSLPAAVRDRRSGYLAAWDAGELLQRLAQRPVSVPALRQDFQSLLRQ